MKFLKTKYIMIVKGIYDIKVVNNGLSFSLLCISDTYFINIIPNHQICVGNGVIIELS